MSSTLLTALALAVSLQGLQERSVSGTIRDAESGAALPGATVVLDDLERAAVSGADGRYRFTDVPAGPQHLSVDRLGYAPRTIHVLVPASGPVELDVALRPRPIELEGLVVSTPRAVRGLDPDDDTPAPDRGLSAAALRSHPLLAEPDAFRALAGGEVVMDPESPSGLHVRGAAADHTAFLLDGVPVLAPYHAAGLFSAWNPDALASVRLTAAAPSPGLPDALAGVVTGTTRTPGPRARGYATVSTGQARATLDGPVGVAGIGYMVSARSGFPGAIAAKDESSYLGGATSDLLAKLQGDLLGGRVALLHYRTSNHIDAAATVPEEGEPAPPRSRFEWEGRSTGATWIRAGSSFTSRVTVWGADADAEADPGPGGALRALDSERLDRGIVAALRRGGEAGGSEVGVRVRRIDTRYRLADVEGETSRNESAAATVTSAWLEHTVGLGARVSLWAGASGATDGRSFRVAPRALVTWRASERLSWTAAYARAHQYAQSLRNPESVVGSVFPADPSVATSASDVAVPVSDQVVLAAEVRPSPGLRLVGQGWIREADGLALVAPREDEALARDAPVRGGSSARGLSLEVTARGARHAFLASWAWQRVEVAWGDSAFVPRHGTSHLIDAGVLFYPGTTSALRAAVTVGAGRSATALSGPFEWEACNLLDQGCEFAGTPRLDGERGAVHPPLYLRVDLGGRKHWHVRAGPRSVLLGVFGTVSNTFGRRNVLTWVVDPATGSLEPVEMMPRSPLVVGVEARF